MYIYSIKNMAEKIEKLLCHDKDPVDQKELFNSCTIVHHIWATFSPLTLDCGKTKQNHIIN